jgi:hypothetical protein
VVTGPAVIASLAGGQTTLTENQSVVIQFNRLLNPPTVNRQTIKLLTAGGSLLTDPNVDYDPVLLTVTLSNPGGGEPWLQSGQTYQVQIPVATPTTEGVLAIDNATVASQTMLEFSVVAADGGGGTLPVEPTMNFCVDVLPVLRAKCAGSVCHSAPEMSPEAATTGAAAGLVLISSEGVAATALGRVAYESNAGPTSGPSSGSCPTTDTQTCLFGVDMPIIDTANNPANSWLLYKVLLATPAGTDEHLTAQCNPFTTEEYVANPPIVAAPTTSPPAKITSAERSRLSNYVLGREMPYPSNPTVPEGSDAGTGAAALSIQELERLRLWIKQGAVVPPSTDDCSKCTCAPGYVLLGGECQSTNGGVGGSSTGDAATSDAGTDASLEAGTSDAGTKG